MDVYHRWLTSANRSRLHELGRRLTVVGFWSGAVLALLTGLALFALTACKSLGPRP